MKLIVASIVEEVVDVVVGDLAEHRLLARATRALLDHHLEHLDELGGGLANAKSHETERAASVEQHDEDDALADDRDVVADLLAFEELSGELLLGEQRRDATGRRDVASR